MPITSSAKKALRASDKKRVNNLRTSAAITDPLKKFRKFVIAKDKKAAQALAPILYKAFDKAAKRNYIKKNTASRGKARIMAAINKIG